MDDVDRISGLPDEIIHHILSFFPTTRRRAATSLLSRRWRPIWAHHPSLDLPLSDTILSPAASAAVAHRDAVWRLFADGAASEEEAEAAVDAASAPLARDHVLAVDSCLRSCSAPTLHQFSTDLWFHPPAAAEAADRWIRFAGDLSVCKLQLRCSWSGRIPSSLFGCSSITDLNISSATFPNVPSNFRGFGSLKSLVLWHSLISNENLQRLLSCCPLLESLDIVRWSDLTHINVKHPNLKKLRLFDCQKLTAPIMIEAPSLVSISYRGDLRYLDWSGSLAMRHAWIRRAESTKFDTQEHWGKLVSAVSNVYTLSVNEWFYQFVSPKLFMLKNLKELILDVEWITGSLLNGIVGNLGQCPLLDKLCIIFSCYETRSDSFCGNTSDDSSAFKYNSEFLEQVHQKFEQDGCDPPKLFGEPRRSLCKLRTIMISWGFMGTTNEMLLVKFLLGNAVALQKFIIKHSLRGDEEELQKLFAPIPRASSQVLFFFSHMSPY